MTRPRFFRAFIIAICIVLLAGNVYGHYLDWSGIGQWNISSSNLAPGSRYFSLSFEILAEVLQLLRGGLPDASAHGWAIVDDALLLLALIMALLFSTKRWGRRSLAFFFAVQLLYYPMLFWASTRMVSALYRDYLPSSWSPNCDQVMHWPFLFPKALYWILCLAGLLLVVRGEHRRSLS